MIFTISARGKPTGMPVLDFLKAGYGSLSTRRIDSVFGFVERSTLYGGRPFASRELTDADVLALYYVGVGVRIPLTNHYVEPAEYAGNRALLDKYHREGNAVIITNDTLARWIRRDFPKYRIEASVIKDIDSYPGIETALELYDTVVLPMRLNENPAFLRRVKNKNRITLFANAGCALTCPSRICYPSISKFNKSRQGEILCSQSLKYRQQRGMVDFDLDALVNLGFSRFKLLRARPGGGTGY